jgi:hypothetical protein
MPVEPDALLAAVIMMMKPPSPLATFLSASVG